MSESDTDTGQPQEQTRLCPTCRMPVSVLATRCRHCGEGLGRPRKAEERFSVEDLGGEAAKEYTVSGDLMDAMESFRMELSGEDAPKNQGDKAGRWFSRDSHNQGAGERKSQFSDLELPGGSLDDIANADIGSSYSTPPPRPATKVTRTAKGGGDYTKYIVGAGVLLALGVGVFLFGPTIKNMLSPPPPVEQVRENRALQIMAAGKPTIEAVEEARAALDHNLSDENKLIQAQVRDKFILEIRETLNAKTFDKAKLEQAFTLSSRAANADSDASIQSLLEQVNKDLSYHRFLLKSIDSANGSATFELNNSYAKEPQQTVKEGDLLQGRFKVDRITSELVRLIDQEVDVPGGKRRLVSRLLVEVAPG